MNLNKWRCICLIGMLCCYSISFAQIDTSFWFAVPDVSDGGNRYDEPIYLNITAIDKTARVKISVPANSSVTPIIATVPVGTSSLIDISYLRNHLENIPGDQVLNKGLYIQSDEFVQIYYDVASTYCNCNPELFTLKGNNALGTEFYIPSQQTADNANNYSPEPRFSFDIVATQNNTRVSITPSIDIINHRGGISFSVTLNRGQTFSSVAKSYQASDHPAGSHVVSDKPIAITIKDDLLEGRLFDGAGADLTGDQIVPVNRIGNEYILVRGKLGTGANERDLACITATRDNTDIYIDGVKKTTLNAGQNVTYEVKKANIYITSSESIYVLHISGLGRELGSALLPAIKCTGSKFVGARRSTSTVFGLYLNIIVPKGAEGNFLVNGNSGVIKSSSFVPVSGTTKWLSAHVQIDSFTVHTGASIIISNNKAAFHIGLFQGAFIHGTAYGYISNYGRFVVPEKTTFPCKSNTFLKKRVTADSVRWSDYSTGAQILVNKPGVYWVDYYMPCETIRDSFIVTPGVRKNNVAKKIPKCPGPMVLKTHYSDSLQWSTGSDDSSIIITNPGVYWVDHYTPCETLRDSFVVEAYSPVSPVKTTLTCKDSLMLAYSGTCDSALWSNGYRTKSIAVSSAGVYWLLKYYACEVVRDSFIVNHSNQITFKKEVFCGNVSLGPINGRKNIRYLWNTGDTTETITPLASANLHWVNILTPCAMERDSFFRITITLPSDTVICGNVDILLSSPQEGTVWNGRTVSKTYAVKETGRYIATFSSKFCSGISDTIDINLSDKLASVYMPNAFTPNDDGINDIFPSHIENVANYRLSIFNRWGEKLFDEMMSSWPGRYKDVIAQEGIYLYLFEYEDCKGIRRYLKGTITLMK